MRKADYSLLARLIREESEAQKKFWPCGASLQNPKTVDRHSLGRVAALDYLARRFSMAAHVNRAEFLKACGIDP